MKIFEQINILIKIPDSVWELSNDSDLEDIGSRLDAVLDPILNLLETAKLPDDLKLTIDR